VTSSQVTTDVVETTQLILNQFKKKTFTIPIELNTVSL